MNIMDNMDKNNKVQKFNLSPACYVNSGRVIMPRCIVALIAQTRKETPRKLAKAASEWRIAPDAKAPRIVVESRRAHVPGREAAKPNYRNEINAFRSSLEYEDKDLPDTPAREWLYATVMEMNNADLLKRRARFDNNSEQLFMAKMRYDEEKIMEENAREEYARAVTLRVSDARERALCAFLEKCYGNVK